MLRKVGESAWPISEKDAVVSIKDPCAAAWEKLSSSSSASTAICRRS